MSAPTASPPVKIPPLRNGDHLDRDEFERRYQAMPDVKKAELIDGIVYMPSPVRFQEHARPHFNLITWLGVYCAATPSVEGADNATVRLDLNNEPQPDALLLIEPERGGRVTFTQGYITGGPELAAEVAASSVSIERNAKLRAYQRNGVQEYLLWRVEDHAIDWFVLRGGQYDPLPVGADGIVRSEVFPGLWLDPPALIAAELGRVLAVLQQGLASPEHAAFVARFPEFRERLQARLARPEHADGAAHGDKPGDPPVPPTTVFHAAPTETFWPRLPGYEILQELGKGGMGVVYKAWQSGLQRVVALKVIRGGAHADAAERARFQIEARVAARLRHPHLVPIHEVGEFQGQPYLVLEYVEGGSLADKLTGTPWAAQSAAELVQALAGGMQHAHRQGVVHRDLKPANVLLDANGTPRISDFGLAKVLVGADMGATGSGEILGTPAYMAPEQAQGKNKEVGPAADVYALGAILYELLTGRPPFLAATVVDTLVQVVSQEPVPVRRLQPKVPRDVETICLKCLEKSPGRRYADAADLAEDLRRWQAGESVKARPVGSLGRASKWVRRSPVLAGMVAATVLALLGGTAVSTYFAVVARDQEKQAVKKEGEAREAEANAREALAQVEKNLALGLLRPLGHFTDEKGLNDFERDALEELASLPGGRDRVRVLFIEQALESADKAGQLDRRLEESLTAAVGLRRDLREKVLSMAGKRLRDARTSRLVRLVCARLAASLAAEDARMAKDAAIVLVEESAAETTDRASRAARLQAFLSLSGKIAQADAAALGKSIVEAAAKEKDPEFLCTLSEALVALSGKLAPAEASKHASTLGKRIVEAAGKDKDPDHLAALFRAFGALSDKLAPAEASKQAAPLRKQILELAAKDKDPDHLARVSRAFLALSDKLVPAEASKDAAALGKQIVELGATTTQPYSLAALSEAFVALSDKLTPIEASKDAAALGLYIVELGVAPRNPNAQPTLSRAFVALSGKIEESDAAALGKQIVELAANVPNSWAALPGAFLSLSGKFRQSDAAALCKRIVELADEARDANTFYALSQAFVALSGKLNPAEARKHAAVLSKHLVEPWVMTRNFEALPTLSRALVALSDKLAPAEASKHAATLRKQILEATAQKPPPDHLAALSRAFVALSDNLAPAEASKHAAALGKQIVELAATTTQPYSLAVLSEAFGALSDKLAPGEAKKYTAALGKHIVELAAKDRDRYHLAALSNAYLAVSGKLAPAETSKHAAALGKQIVEMATTSHPDFRADLLQAFLSLSGKTARPDAAAFAKQIVAAAAKDKDPAHLAVMSKLVLALAPRLHREQASNIAGFLLSRLAERIHQQRPDEHASMGLENLCELVSSQHLLDLLKQPGCAGRVRTVILNCLSRRLDRKFHNVWDLVEHIEHNAHNLDYAAPLNREQWTPQATRRQIDSVPSESGGDFMGTGNSISSAGAGLTSSTGLP